MLGRVRVPFVSPMCPEPRVELCPGVSTARRATPIDTARCRNSVNEHEDRYSTQRLARLINDLVINIGQFATALLPNSFGRRVLHETTGSILITARSLCVVGGG